jgi:hypothetical protein
VLHDAATEALSQLAAVAAAVYLLDENPAELRLAMIAGSPPSIFTLRGRMGLDASDVSARALAPGQAVVRADRVPAALHRKHVLPDPYVALSAPLIAADQRFGSLTALRPETRGDYQTADRKALLKVGDKLARALAELHERAGAITPGPVPLLVPAWDPDTSICTPGWGVSGVPGSAGTSLMYPLRRLADLLNQATTMDDIVAAARYCVMSPFRARALVLASASEGRLWVLGHSGTSSGIVRNLHGARLNAQTPAADAARGHALFMSERRSSAADTGCPDSESHAQAYLPLSGSGRTVDTARPAGSARRVQLRQQRPLPLTSAGRPRRAGAREGGCALTRRRRAALSQCRPSVRTCTQVLCWSRRSTGPGKTTAG